MELQDQIEKYCATKVELMAFREEVAVQFGKVHTAIASTHVEIAKLETKIATMEARLIKWFVGIIIANATISLAIARYLS
ncbi:hypothetical protein HH213_13470 [Duganella dendranthematis]|jgi:hypothetical protein|uniref:DUF1640 domain-containing protein n=1 Tax=Duganella dendranthematis TaxID=2728021 RepID=A0ABX6MA46_9BURK|nr:hypothetical protein [Duganella dendranthematis]QJD91005.1 hypothetical protein HH213_13470 [Duganella dendranthematis]